MAIYATVAQVREFLGLETGTPADSIIENFLEVAQDEIDEYTGHAWREKTALERHHMPYNRRNTLGRRWTRVVLRHRVIKAFDDTQGDFLKVWDGSNDVDYLTDPTYTEGRNNDFWLEPIEGYVYLIPRYFNESENAIQIQYRYGETTVPADVKQATIYLASHYLLQADDRSIYIPEGGDNIPLQNKDNNYKSRAYELLRRRQELTLVGTD